MYTQVAAPNERNSRSLTSPVALNKNVGPRTFDLVDNRPEALAQRRLDEVANNYTAANAAKKMGQDGADPVQRDIENATYNDSDEANAAASAEFFSSYNTAVQNAYQFAITVPSLGAYAALDGHTGLWIEKWREYINGGRPKLMAAAFGYVIESLVSDPRSEFHPAAPSSCSVDNQVVSGGTRPDLVLRLARGSQHIAWLDLTASSSADHIFEKDSWSSKVGNFAEVTYPSITPATMALMLQNKDNVGHLSKEDFDARVALAKEIYAARKAQWKTLGQQFMKSKYSIPRYETEGNVREFVRAKLVEYFNPAEPLELTMVPSILRALEVPTKSWMYNTGYSESEKAGEAWLVDNDPSL